MEIPTRIKYQARLLAIIAAIMLVPGQWNTAKAQTAISFSLSGTGTGTVSSFSLSGNGTITPYGATTVSIIGGSSAGSFGITFKVTFGNGSWTASSTPTSSKNVVLGIANITAGTGDFAGAIGSFTYTTTITSKTSDNLTFTATGSGTLGTTSQTYYFSHLAFAGGWQMTLTYINYSPDTVICSTTFYSNSGTALPVPFSEGTISIRTDTLTAGQSIHDQTVANATATVDQGWAQASCTGPIMASLLYRLYQSGTPVGEASVNAETAPTTKFVTFAQTATGVAYANPSTTESAMITFTVISSTGTQLGMTTVTLKPLAHGSANLGPLLGLTQSFTGFVEITSTIPVISLSLNAEAFPVFSSLPPGDLPSSTTLFTP